MPRKPSLVKLTVLVPAETKRALQRLARTKAWSVGTYVRYALFEHLHLEGAATRAKETPREERQAP